MLILSFKLILQIFLRHFGWKTSSLCISFLGIAQISLAYSNVDCTITLYKVHLMPLLMHSSSQTCNWTTLTRHVLHLPAFCLDGKV